MAENPANAHLPLANLVPRTAASAESPLSCQQFLEPYGKKCHGDWGATAPPDGGTTVAKEEEDPNVPVGQVDRRGEISRSEVTAQHQDVWTVRPPCPEQCSPAAGASQNGGVVGLRRLCQGV